MNDMINEEIQQLSIEKKETEDKSPEKLTETEEKGKTEIERLKEEVQEINEKYLRLYAEFENYKKRVNKDKEELIKYGNESLIYELLPVIDNLEMAIKHATSNVNESLIQGVEITLKELKKTLEKFGLIQIEAENKPFDPQYHHAMSQVERDDIEENMVVEELRKGYMLKDKVLRPSFVTVSKKSIQKTEEKLEN
jgi:molecular chaperone GrpE